MLDIFDLDEGVVPVEPYHFIALDLSDNNFDRLTLLRLTQDLTNIDLLNREVKKVAIEISDITKPMILTLSDGYHNESREFDISNLVLA